MEGDSQRSLAQGTPESEESPAPYHRSHSSQETQNEIEGKANEVSGEYGKNQPFFFNSSHRVHTDVDKAYEEDDVGAPGIAKIFGSWREFWKAVRPSWILDHLDWKSFKVAFRTWLSLFFTLLMVVITPTDKFFGLASYLGWIQVGIEGAGGISYFHAFYSSLLDLVFIVFGFTVPTVAHGISWRIRGYPTVEDFMVQLSEQGICGITDAECFLHEIHKGRYLTTKTTVVELIGIFFAQFLSGWAATQSKLFIIPFILCCITNVIVGTYLLYTPQFDPWLYGRAVIVPMAFGLASRVLLSFIVFPVSSNYKFFAVINQALNSAKNTLFDEIQQIEDAKPSSEEYPSLVLSTFQKVESSLSQFAVLELEGLVCRAEITFSRFDPGDLGEFRSLTRMFVASLTGLKFFFTEVLQKRELFLSRTEMRSNEKEDNVEDSMESEHNKRSSNKKDKARRSIRRRYTLDQQDSQSDGHKWLKSRISRNYAPAGNFEDYRRVAAISDWEDLDLKDLDDLYPLVIEHYRPIGDAIRELMDAVYAWSTAAHNFRILQWLYAPSRRKHQNLQAESSKRVENALAALEAVNEEKNRKFNEWAETFRKTHTSRNSHHYINALSLDAFFGCSVRRIALSARRLGQYCLFLDHEQPNPRVVYPFMRLRSKSPRFESEYLMAGVVTDSGAGDQAYSYYENQDKVQGRNPDSTPPRNYYHLLGGHLQNIFKIYRNPQVMFSAKRAAVVLAPTLMYCTRTTIYWSYKYRVVWVTIMTAITVSYQALDGVYGFVLRLVFSWVGCLIGMIAWYIGSGSGRGNPYGIAASCGVVMFFNSYYRHFSGQAVPMGPILVCVTVAIVAGTSWVDSKMDPLDVDLRWGWRMAWMRYVSVVVGLTIAFIATVLPKPVTAKKNIRVMLGSCLELFGDIQTSVCNFGNQRKQDPLVHIMPRQDIIRLKVRKLMLTTLAAKQLAGRLDYEPPLSGYWPKHKYSLLLNLLEELSHIMNTVHFLLDGVENTEHMPYILHEMGWTNVELISGFYSVLVLSSRALVTAKPLPSVTSGYLSELYTHFLWDYLHLIMRKEDQDLKELVKARYTQRDGRITMSLIICMNMMYTRVDGVIRLIKGLVGEIYSVDLSTFDHDTEAGLLWFNEHRDEFGMG